MKWVDRDRKWDDRGRRTKEGNGLKMGVGSGEELMKLMESIGMELIGKRKERMGEKMKA